MNEPFDLRKVLSIPEWAEVVVDLMENVMDETTLVCCSPETCDLRHGPSNFIAIVHAEVFR